MSSPRRSRQILTFAGFAALGLVSWLQTSAMSRWLGDRLALNAREIAGPLGDIARFGAPSDKPAPSAHRADTLQPAQPLAPVQTESSQRKDPYAASDCSDPAHLTILAAGQDARGSIAVLTTPSSAGPARWELLHVGDAHADKRVWHIGRDRIWLHGKGETCQIRMFEPPQAPIPGSQPGGGVPPTKEVNGIQKVASNEFRVDRALLDRVLQNPAELMKVRVVPDARQGAMLGLRLFGIKPDSLLGVLGLQDGDRLDAVNGMALRDTETMMLALARLRMEKRLVFKLTRGGKEMDIDISVV
jgi:general secretion pathway protein C